MSLDLLPAAPPDETRRPWLPAASAAVVIAALAAVLLVVVRSGGHGGDSVDPTLAVQAASKRAATVGTSTVSLQLTVHSGGHTVTATGGGAFDYRRQVGQLHMELGAVGTMQEVVTRQALYLRLPDAAAGVLGSAARPWLEVRWAGLRRSGVDYSKLMGSSGGSDPASVLRVLSQVTQVHRVGTARIAGVDTTHYAATSTIAQLAHAQAGAAGANLSQLPPSVAAAPVTFDVYVDATGLPRRVTTTASMASSGGMTMTMDFSDYGHPVDVVVPSPSVVTDVTRTFASASHG